jgi:hypothetical protein
VILLGASRPDSVRFRLHNIQFQSFLSQLILICIYLQMNSRLKPNVSDQDYDFHSSLQTSCMDQRYVPARLKRLNMFSLLQDHVAL